MFQPAALRALETVSKSLMAVKNLTPFCPSGISSGSSGSIRKQIATLANH